MTGLRGADHAVGPAHQFPGPHNVLSKGGSWVRRWLITVMGPREAASRRRSASLFRQHHGDQDDSEVRQKKPELSGLLHSVRDPHTKR